MERTDNSSSPNGAVVYNGRAYFIAKDRTHGTELFVTDGTVAGTGLFLDIRPGFDSSQPTGLIANNGLLVPWIQLHPFTGKPVPYWVILSRRARFAPMGALLAKSAPPPAPAPESPEAWARLRRGATVFAETCSECHGDYRHTPALTPDGRPGLRTEVLDYPERIVDPEEVGTDPRYARSSDPAFLRAFAESGLGRAQIFSGQLTGGYVARPLVGARLRAPYLHNASVPSLEALLTPPLDRPPSFRAASSPERVLERDARIPGNGNQGHPFGTDLAPADKRALIEFLRRL